MGPSCASVGKSSAQGFIVSLCELIGQIARAIVGGVAWECCLLHALLEMPHVQVALGRAEEELCRSSGDLAGAAGDRGPHHCVARLTYASQDQYVGLI